VTALGHRTQAIDSLQVKKYPLALKHKCLASKLLNLRVKLRFLKSCTKPISYSLLSALKSRIKVKKNPATLKKK
jgi:hypothetical protein